VRRWARAWLAITVIAAAIGLFIGWNLLYQLDGIVYDWGILAQPPRPPDDRIVILGIDEAFVAGRHVGLTPRDRLARLIENVAQGHPAVIFLDVWLDTRVDDTPTGQDAQLRQALLHARQQGVAVLLPQVDIAGTPENARANGLAAHDQTLRFFTEAAAGTGAVAMEPDADGIYCTLPGVSPTRPSLPIFAARIYLHQHGQALSPMLFTRLAHEVTPIDFAGGQGAIDIRPAIDFVKEPALGALLTDKIVFIGATFPRSQDLFPTPYTREAKAKSTITGHQQMYGVELLAHSTLTVLDGARRHAATTHAVWMQVAVLTGLLAAAIAALALSGAVWGMAGGAIAIAGAGTVAYLSARQPAVVWGWHSWPVSPFMVSAILASGLGVAYRQLEGAREIRLIKEVFAGYVSDEVLQQLRGHMPPTAEMRDIAVLFCDIEGYSALAEKLRDDPIQLLGELNAHFEPLVAALKSRGAYTDNYVGDLVMALFGAPTTRGSLEADTRNAVLAALDFIRIVQARNEGRRAAGQVPIEVGVGVHCGPAVTGYLGSQQRLHFTAIGDTVNIASRVESTTRKYDTHLLVTEEVVQACAGAAELTHLQWEFVAETQVKGRVAPVRLYRCDAGASE
jgi:adenylate cyclase